jgi:HTH-type transcriptional regulator/antitoxin HigA
MAIAAPELVETIMVWPTISRVVSVPHTQEEYEQAVRRLDELIDEVGGDEDHSLASLMETLGTLIENYENNHFREPTGDPISSLKHLMADHNLRQTDLPEVGSQGIVSEILNGKRQLNIRQIKALSERFHVSPAVFL